VDRGAARDFVNVLDRHDEAVPVLHEDDLFVGDDGIDGVVMSQGKAPALILLGICHASPAYSM
jgi:hypothetical protein